MALHYQLQHLVLRVEKQASNHKALSMDPTELHLETAKLEYAALKAEQLKRIEHRDQIIYLQIVAMGALFGTSDKISQTLLCLLVPFPCLALGWTYLVNDQKISAIGKYIRQELESKFGALAGGNSGTSLFGWEVAHRSDRRRGQRKVIQLLIDIVVFVVPGIFACAWQLYQARHFSFNPPRLEAVDSVWFAIACVELVFLIALMWQILSYADLRSGK